MTESERRNAAKAFSEKWIDRGEEKSDTHSFWLDLLRDVYGVAEPSKTIRFERRGMVERRKKLIDGYIRRDEGGGILIERRACTSIWISRNVSLAGLS